MNEKTTRIIRWTARIWSALMAALILIIFIGDAVAEGIGPLFGLSLRDILMMVAFFIVFLGLILGWKWERLAGYLIVGGMVAFYLVDFLLSEDFPRGPTFLMIAFPGFLYLLASLRKDAVAA